MWGVWRLVRDWSAFEFWRQTLAAGGHQRKASEVASLGWKPTAREQCQGTWEGITGIVWRVPEAGAPQHIFPPPPRLDTQSCLQGAGVHALPLGH